MVNASLNWASIAQIIFVLNRRAENNKASITRSIFIFVIGFGRCIGSLLVGGILFFQSWRLDPVFQFAFLILVVGLIIESSSGFLKDRKEWSGRKKIKN